MKLRITKLDHNGYNGRDHYAQDSDVGTVVLAIGMNAQVSTPEGERVGAALDGGIAAYPAQTTEDTLEICWTCLTPDGRTVELMAHEVKVVQ